MEVKAVIEHWYIQLMYNNRNSPAYVDMINDMAALGEGVFTCTFKINEGNICDYVFTQNEQYADFRPPKTY